MMISRSLTRRLERLETTVMPTSNPVVLELQFNSPEKVVTKRAGSRLRCGHAKLFAIKIGLCRLLTF
jgi:hypothetical protein